MNNEVVFFDEHRLVKDIHASPYKVVLAITGGGTEAIGKLLKYGDGSNTLLEAVVPYATSSFIYFLGKVPEKFCSPEAAKDLAVAAYERALNLDKETPPEHLLGISATCSLIKAGVERAGRKHVAYFGLKNNNSYRSYSIELTSHRSRPEEEAIIADLILNLIGVGCNIPEFEENFKKMLNAWQ